MCEGREVFFFPEEFSQIPILSIFYVNHFLLLLGHFYFTVGPKVPKMCHLDVLSLIILA